MHPAPYKSVHRLIFSAVTPRCLARLGSFSMYTITSLLPTQNALKLGIAATRR